MYRRYTLPQDAPPHVWANRATQVKQAFLHAYHGYEAYAAPFDELRPLSNSKINNFNGWGVTAFDSLDTMLLMGLQDEYSRALDIVRQANFTHSETVPVPYFETIIRYLGGLLSAYTFSKDSTLIKRAEDLVTKLEPVFNTQSGMPYFGIDPSSNKTYGPNIGILAEVASLQLEYYYLAKLTGKKRHFKHADNVMHALSSANLTSTGGMFPVRWNLTSGEPFDTRLSVGAQADSAHEYLLKHYLMTAKGDKKSLEMYIRATTHIITDLLYLSPTRHLLYVTDTTHPTNESRASASHLFEHLSCFLPGLFALGAHSLPLDDLYLLGIDFRSLVGHKLYGFAGMNHERLSEWNLKQLHMWAAEGLAQTCWLTYADQPSGLGPDEMIMFNPGKRAWDSKSSQWVYKDNAYLWLEALEKWKRTGGRGPPPGVGAKSPIAYYPSDRSSQRAKRRDYLIRKSGYLLRPETVESLYILWRVTGNYKWRVRGWEIFKALKRETMTTSGFASLESVEMTPAPKADSMPSYFMAETLKYLYLMFLNEDPVPLDKFVFNTEAHPFPIFKWTEEERELFSE
ncbi:glycoside hydrolase family 47 protein [Amanita thiersii Skay4041]|uniref:alpha-1,2-Mannosidase n=1 Tax=Amanita thiersii Skay4041 TaxID=703135 RepID=A0A2A9NVZ0_9AGAR|nr:glycoside hydrolase family 47 protein [Amanita thiersii Skay4041]